MKRRISFAAAVVVTACLTGSLTATPSLATSDGFARTIKVVPQPLEVKSNGHRYTGVNALGNIVADVHVKIVSNGSLDGWKIWLKIGAETVPVSDWHNFSDFPTGDDFQQGEEPSGIELLAKVIVPAIAHEEMALEHCNDLADDLRSGGSYSDEVIFGQDRTIELGVRAAIQWDSNSGVGNSFYPFESSDEELPWTHIKKLQLVCKKYTPIQAADTVYIPEEIKSSSLEVEEHATHAAIAGRCRMTLRGVIETAEPDVEVSFRYKDGADNESKVHDVVSNHNGVATFSHDYDVPVNPDGIEKGMVRIVGVSHSFTSAWERYELDCREPSFEAHRLPSVEIHVQPLTEIKVGDQYCHDRLRFYAKIVGQSTAMSGQGIFAGDYYLSEPQPYDIAPGQTTLVGAERELDWSSDPQGAMATMPNDPNELKEQTIKMGFNLANANGTVVVQVPKKPYTIRCRKVSRNPMAVQAIGDHDDVSAAPRPQPGSPAAPRLRLAPQAAQPTAPTAPRRLQPRPQGADEPTAPLRRMQRLRLKQ